MCGEPGAFKLRARLLPRVTTGGDVELREEGEEERLLL